MHKYTCIAVLMSLLVLLVSCTAETEESPDTVPASPSEPGFSETAEMEPTASEEETEPEEEPFFPDPSGEPVEIAVTETDTLLTTLPIVEIHTEQPVSGKENYVDGEMTITYQGQVLYGEEENGIQIKWRGNSSLAFDKKPYKIKLAEKTSLFGFSSSRHWLLLACMFDRSMIRDKLALDFSSCFFDFHTKSTWVEVFLNDKYAGTYQLCEQVRLEKDRLNITDIEDRVEEDGIGIEQYTTANGYDITGGYLLELSVQYDEKSKFHTNIMEIPVMVKSPEDAADNPEMIHYLEEYFQDFELCIQSSDMFSTQNKHYSELFDMTDLVNYWVLSSIYKTHDFMINSTYLYKDAADENGTEDKFHMGPIWDIGNSLGNFTAANNWKTPAKYDTWDCPADDYPNWYTEICKDPYFMVRAEEAFAEIADDVIDLTTDGGLIDAYAELLRPSVAANQLLYPTFKNGMFGLPKLKTLDDEIAWIKEFLTGRIDFMRGELADLRNISLSYCDFSDERIGIRLETQEGEELQPGQVPDGIGVCADYASDLQNPVCAVITSSIPEAVTAKVYVNAQKIGKYSLLDQTASALIDGEVFLNSHEGKNVVIVRLYNSRGILLGTNFVTLANQAKDEQ